MKNILTKESHDIQRRLNERIKNEIKLALSRFGFLRDNHNVMYILRELYINISNIDKIHENIHSIIMFHSHNLNRLKRGRKLDIYDKNLSREERNEIIRRNNVLFLERRQRKEALKEEQRKEYEKTHPRKVPIRKTYVHNIKTRKNVVKPKVDTVVSRVYNEPEYLLGDYDIEYIPDKKKKKKIEPEIQYEVKKRRNLIKSNVIEK